MARRVWQHELDYINHPESPPFFDDECEEFFKLIEDEPHAVDNGDGTGSLKGKLVGMGF